MSKVYGNDRMVTVPKKERSAADMFRKRLLINFSNRVEEARREGAKPEYIRSLEVTSGIILQSCAAKTAEAAE